MSAIILGLAAIYSHSFAEFKIENQLVSWETVSLRDASQAQPIKD